MPPAGMMVAPVKAERKMLVTVMMPHVVMMPATMVPPAFDLDNRLVEVIRISLGRAAGERKR
jgi:hypothetical protein